MVLIWQLNFNFGELQLLTLQSQVEITTKASKQTDSSNSKKPHLPPHPQAG